MPKRGLAKAVHKVDEPIAIEVVDKGPFGRFSDNREGQLFPFGPEASCGPWVCEDIAVLRRVSFRCRMFG